ncbi:MAG: hypothetical protein WED04_07425 [Promethearchaeati archaeon SRVP18_Atabeyarchaeia-1]
MSEKLQWENLLPAFFINGRGEAQLRVHARNLASLDRIIEEGCVIATGFDEDGFMTIVLKPRSRLIIGISTRTHNISNVIHDIGLGLPLWICVSIVERKRRPPRRKAKPDMGSENTAQKEYKERAERSTKENLALMYV